jgi:uncharacterized protein (DUF1501 family)
MNQSRRQFLKTAFGGPALLSLGGAAPGFLIRAAGAAEAEKRTDRVLVVVQLSGGNDGLNTVAPYADDAYGRKRTTLRLGKSDVIKIDDHVGFHPKMEGFSRLLKDSRLAIVQGVGCPVGDRSHPGAMRNRHTARPEQPRCPTGWIGRAIDAYSDKNPAGAAGLFVGGIARPLAMNARISVVPSIRSADQLTFRQKVAAAKPAVSKNALLNHVRTAATNAYAADSAIRAVLAKAPRNDRYPSGGLGPQLRTVAQLIGAETGVRIFMTELGGGGIGGFDNHAIQRDNHASLLANLSASIEAFARDLAARKLLDRVALMTFSEFGRTLTENGRKGTGHGNAAPVFVMGGKVRSGLIGKHPSLDDLDNDAPRHHTDFRRLYATMLSSWLGLESGAILGPEFKPLDLFTA